jgi:hypothetical protein
MQQYHTHEPTRGEIAEALHEWRTALAAATESVEAELYACASVLVLDSLARYTTFRELINAYFFLDPDKTSPPHAAGFSTRAARWAYLRL